MIIKIILLVNKYNIVAINHNSIEIWNVEIGELVQTQKYSFNIRCSYYSPDNKYIALGHKKALLLSDSLGKIIRNKYIVLIECNKTLSVSDTHNGLKNINIIIVMLHVFLFRQMR